MYKNLLPVVTSRNCPTKQPLLFWSQRIARSYTKKTQCTISGDNNKFCVKSFFFSKYSLFNCITKHFTLSVMQPGSNSHSRRNNCAKSEAETTRRASLVIVCETYLYVFPTLLSFLRPGSFQTLITRQLSFGNFKKRERASKRNEERERRFTVRDPLYDEKELIVQILFHFTPSSPGPPRTHGTYEVDGAPRRPNERTLRWY